MTATDTSPKHFTEPAEVADLIAHAFAEFSKGALGVCQCPGCGRIVHHPAATLCIPCTPDALGCVNHAHGYGGDLASLRAERDALAAELTSLRQMVYRFLISGGVTAPDLLARIRGTEGDL